MNIPELEKFVISRLRSELDPRFTYHNAAHTAMVLDAVRVLTKEENCTAEEKELLEIAAILHDCGFLIGAEKHEEHSCVIARQILPDFKVEEEKIKKVCSLIMATVSGYEPKEKLEMIMRDADVFYLGGKDYGRISDQLFTELRNLSLISENEKKWNELQIHFLQKHRFYTSYARSTCEEEKKKTLNSLLQKDHV